MDKIREEFEAWFCSTIPYPIAKESWFAVMNDGDYIITDVQAAWAGWKASRAALCVELPYSGFSEFYGDALHGYATAIDLVRDALIDAGVDGK